MASLGEDKTSVGTPALCLDLGRFETNLDRITGMISKAGKAWRPHTACHKSPEIAKRELQQGAVGLACAKVTEAEVFAEQGLGDILIAHPSFGIERARRLVDLKRKVDVIVSCDHYVQAEQISTECLRHGITLRALVEINIGMDRTGVRPGHDTLELARGIERLPGLKLAGILGFEGHAMTIKNWEDRRRCIDAALGILSHTRDLFQKNGFCFDMISAGGSGSLSAAIQCEALTEIRAGSVVFGDVSCSNMPGARELEPALTILSTVVSRPAYDRAVLDAGLSAISAEQPFIIQNWPDAKVARFCAEQIVLELGPDSRELRIGDRVELMVSHSGMTTWLHNHYLCFRNGRFEGTWPIKARGKLI